MFIFNFKSEAMNYTLTFSRSLAPIWSETCSHASSLVGDTAWCTRNRHLSKPLQPLHLLCTSQGNHFESFLPMRYPVQQVSWHAPLFQCKMKFHWYPNTTTHHQNLFGFDLGRASVSPCETWNDTGLYHTTYPPIIFSFKVSSSKEFTQNHINNINHI